MKQRMKRTVIRAVSFLLTVIFLISVGASLLYVDASSKDSPTWETLGDNSVTYGCTYDRDTSKIHISGTVNHDTLIRYRKYTIDVYAISPFGNIDEIFAENVQPLASVKIAVKFEFTVLISTLEERFSRYALVLHSPEGEKLLAAEPKSISVDSTYVYTSNDRTPYQGIQSEQTSVAGSIGAGTAVIPVFLNQLFSTTSDGIIYPIDQTFLYFDRAYVDALDAKVRTYSASGTRIYLQLLLPAANTDMATADGQAVGADYIFPNVTNPDVLRKIVAYVEFLTERYDSVQNGQVSGFVLGSSIDRGMQNYCGDLSVTEYAKRYAIYLMVVAHSARTSNAQIDITVPFSQINTYANAEGIVGEGNYDPKMLLEGIISYVDKLTDEPFSFSTMIESMVLPSMFEKETATQENGTKRNSVLGVENLSLYENYLSTLSRRFKSVPTHFMYHWTASATLQGNDLGCAYAYSYYKLLQHKMLQTFLVSFEDASALSNLTRLLRGIDTEEGLALTEPYLAYFEAESWGEVLSTKDFSAPTLRRNYRTRLNEVPKMGFLGEFDYFDFSTGAIDGWYCGAGCKSVKSDSFLGNDRGARAMMSKETKQDAGELLCLWEYSENLVYTPYLKLTLAVTEENQTANGLYKISVSIGNETATVLGEQLITAGEKNELWIDLSKLRQEDLLIDYMKINAVAADGTTENFSLWVCGVTGYSTQYTAEELRAMIEAERLRLRNQATTSEEDERSRSLLWVAFGALFLLTVMGIGVAVLMNRGAKKTEQEDDASEQESPPKF